MLHLDEDDLPDLAVSLVPDSDSPGSGNEVVLLENQGDGRFIKLADSLLVGDDPVDLVVVQLTTMMVTA